ncbi:MAG: hypothetical protein ACRCUY_11690 [Thermoguttaceae bacterium]
MGEKMMEVQNSQFDLVIEQEQDKKTHKTWRFWVLSFFAGIFCFGIFFGAETLMLPFKDIPYFLFALSVTALFWAAATLPRKLFVPPPKSRTWRLAAMNTVTCFVIIGTGFGGLLCMQHFVPPVKITKETTFLTEPRTPDGKEIDILAAIEQRVAPKCKPSENGFRRIVQIFGTKWTIDLPDKKRQMGAEQICKKLDLDVNLLPECEYLPLEQFLKESIENENDGNRQNALHEQQLDLTKAPWNEETAPQSAAWLKKYSPALDAFGEAVRLPEFFVPIYVSGKNVTIMQLLPSDMFLRKMAQNLHYRVMHSLAEQHDKIDFEKITFDLETIFQLSTKMLRHPTCLMQFLNGFILRERGFSALTKVLEHGNWTTEQLEILHKIFRQNSAIPSLSEMAWFVRLEELEVLFSLSSGRILTEGIYEESPPKTPFEKWWIQLNWSGLNYFVWNPIFERQQKNHIRFDAIAAMPISLAQMEAAETWERESMASAPRNVSFYNMFKLLLWKGKSRAILEMIVDVRTGLCAPIYKSYFVSWHRNKLQVGQLEMLLALKLFHSKHGKYPDAADELVGEYFDSLPLNPFSDGEPIKYAIDEAGVHFIEVK